jgi:hypothetical protein
MKKWIHGGTFACAESSWTPVAQTSFRACSISYLSNRNHNFEKGGVNAL